MTRSLSFAVLALAVSACEPDLPHTPAPTVVTAVFDPLQGKIPLPNDLAFMATAESVCGPNVKTCAQLEFLAALGGFFPNDQPVAVTIEFSQIGTQDGKTVETAPDLDLSTVITSDADPAKAPTVFVYSLVPGSTGLMPLDPVKDTDYAKGTLALHYQGGKPWPPGAYAVAVRGGANGIKTKDNLTVSPSSVFHLIEQGKDMTDPKNMGLLRLQTPNGTFEEAKALGAQLNLLIALYSSSAFPAIDTKFPHQELAVAATFRIAPLATHVPIDPETGTLPLPIDLLRDPGTGKLSLAAACTFAGSKLAADGTCPSPSAAAFQTLDGFSTTGTILAPMSDLIDASSVTSTSVLLFELPPGGAMPMQVSPDTLIFEPCEFTSAAQTSPPCNNPSAQGLSPAIAIQPAGATAGKRPGDATAVFRTRPLKENTDYGVVITNAVHDKAGKAIDSTTAAKLLRLPSPLIANGTPTLSGVDAATAGLLEPMRAKLAPVFNAGLADRTKVAMAYTFHTQTITTPAVRLAALPYTTPAATAAPGAVTVEDAATVFARFGVANTVPSENIAKILSTDITTFNALDPATGAFLADPTKAVPETIHVMIAMPKADNANAPFCNGQSLPRCAPMMVFRHGLGRGRADMLMVADRFAAAGLVTVAIDAAKHGDRAFCTSGQTGAAAGCNPSVACTTTLPAGAQGDANPPGRCTDGKLLKHAVGSDTVSDEGIPVVSGNYLVSANLFRTRDTLRQDLIDESQLIRAIAFVPTGAGATGHMVFDTMAGLGVVIDPSKIYYTGQSLGAIQGAMNVAANPRISKAGLNVGGGTIVDIFTNPNSDTFKSQVDKLLQTLGIERNTPKYLQFLVVAKTVLDPADPLNFVGHLTEMGKTLPNLLPPLGGNVDGTKLQDPKRILNQMANCDDTVPNFTGYLYASNTGSTPLPPSGAAGTFELFASTVPPVKCDPGVKDVPHGFLTDWANAARAQKAQDDIAAFVKTDTLPASVQQH